MTNLRVVYFQEENYWLAQGLEHDICVQANSISDLYGKFEVAVRLETENGSLDHIPAAPAHYFDLWEKRSGEFSPKNAKADNLTFAMAA